MKEFNLNHDVWFTITDNGKKYLEEKKMDKYNHAIAINCAKRKIYNGKEYITIKFNYPQGRTLIGKYDSWELIKVEYINEKGKRTEAGKRTIIETAYNNTEFEGLLNRFRLTRFISQRLDGEIYTEYNSQCFGIKGNGRDTLYYIIGYLSIENESKEKDI